MKKTITKQLQSIIKVAMLFCLVAFTGISLNAQPTITSFTPTSGAVGATVTITGTGFNTTPANNIVFFGATRATVTAATVTSLTVTVPTGATFGAITVLNTGTSLAAYSTQFFNPTFSPNKSSITTADIAAKVDFATGSSPYSVAIGDLDGDGKPDLAVANNGSNTVSVYRNTSSSGSIAAGSFAAKVDFTTGSAPRSVAIGDLDGDGKPDLAVANYGSTTVSVYRNTSTSGSIAAGSFAAKVDFATGSAPRSVAIGDLDGDGKPDLAVANYGSTTVSVYRNTSTSGSIVAGSFAAKVDFTTGTQPFSVAIGDLDGDGKPDLAVANLSSNTVSVLRNTSTSGSIAAGSFAAKVDFTTGTNPISVAIGDLDGDGKPDLAVANFNSASVSIYRNTSTSGSIAAGSFAAKVDFAAGSGTYSLAIGDLDGDGKPDLAVANFQPNTVSVYRNTSTSGSIVAGSFAAKVDFTTGTQPYSVAIGDLDGDGKPDLAVANVNSATVSVFRNTSTSGSIVAGSFAAKVDFATGTQPYSVAIGDLDGDGKPDLAVANVGSASVSVLRNADIATLPVKITDITAQLQTNNTVAVNWLSATEVNLANYQIQRSSNGSSFSTVGTVAAKGASAYNYVDNLSSVNYQLPTVFYRLEAVDKDGSKQYSKVVAVALANSGAKKALFIYPNPVKETLFAQVTVTKAGAAQLRVVDAQGKVVATQKTQLTVGTTSVSIPATHLAVGSYTLQIETADGKQQQRFVK